MELTDILGAICKECNPNTPDDLRRAIGETITKLIEVGRDSEALKRAVTLHFDEITLAWK